MKRKKQNRASAHRVEVEGTGETVGEAKWAAVRELERLAPGLDKASVRFQVVSEGERGLLGVGYSPARVIARLDLEDAQPGRRRGRGPVASRVREILERGRRAARARRRRLACARTTRP